MVGVRCVCVWCVWCVVCVCVCVCGGGGGTGTSSRSPRQETDTQPVDVSPANVEAYVNWLIGDALGDFQNRQSAALESTMVTLGNS